MLMYMEIMHLPKVPPPLMLQQPLPLRLFPQGTCRIRCMLFTSPSARGYRVALPLTWEPLSSALRVFPVHQAHPAFPMLVLLSSGLTFQEFLAAKKRSDQVFQTLVLWETQRSELAQSLFLALNQLCPPPCGAGLSLPKSYTC